MKKNEAKRRIKSRDKRDERALKTYAATLLFIDIRNNYWTVGPCRKCGCRASGVKDPNTINRK